MSEQALNVYDYAEEKGAAFRVAMRGIEWMSPCIVPGCSSQQDAFSVQPEGKRTGRWAGYGAWMCRKCWNPEEIVTWKDGTRRKKGWGTLADLVMVCEGMSYHDAETFILAREGGSSFAPHAAPRYATQTQITDEEWYVKYVPYLKAALLDENGIASTYCASRGLKPETVTFLKFGFSLDPVKMKDDTYRTIPFLVIPWHKDDGTLYRKVNRRNLHTPLPGDEDKYRLVSGSQKEDLYLGYSLKQQKRPTFLVESELDAATIFQEAGDIVNVVATGSVGHGMNAVNEGRLRRQPFVFVAFDADADGEKAATYWLGKLDPAKSIRYKPLMHDANEMHTKGMSVRKWVEAGIEYFIPFSITPSFQPAPPPEPSQVVSDSTNEQAANSMSVSDSEQADKCCRCDGPAQHTSPRGSHYCSEHYRCYRGHALQWRETRFGWVCASCDDEEQQRAERETVQHCPVVRADDAYTPEEVAMVARLQPYDVQLTMSPCVVCGCRLQRCLFGLWECAACLPYNVWSDDTIARVSAARYSSTPPQENYSTRLRARLGDFKAEVPDAFLKLAERPRTYPAPFPCHELVMIDGVWTLQTVGMWSPEPGAGLLEQPELCEVAL